MSKYRSPSRFLAAGALTFAGLMAAGGALAAGAATPQTLRYQQEQAKCLSGESNQDRATCLKEAGAALQESRNRTLGAPSDGELAENRQKRCEALPSPDREDCSARMNDGAASGSAQQGGILREHTGPQ